MLHKSSVFDVMYILQISKVILTLEVRLESHMIYLVLAYPCNSVNVAEAQVDFFSCTLQDWPYQQD